MSDALKMLEPLFERAEREGLWFYSNYQGLWFSPAQHRKEHANGKFRWGPVNWQLLPPSEYIAGAEQRAKQANEELGRVRAYVESQTAGASP